MSSSHPKNTTSTTNTQNANAQNVNAQNANPKKSNKSWSSALRSPWTVACAAVAVVLGPSAVTASALERANSAPLHGATAPDRARHHAAPYAAAQYAYLPRSTYRGQPLKRSQSLG